MLLFMYEVVYACGCSCMRLLMYAAVYVCGCIFKTTMHLFSLILNILIIITVSFISILYLCLGCLTLNSCHMSCKRLKVHVITFYKSDSSVLPDVDEISLPEETGGEIQTASLS